MRAARPDRRWRHRESPGRVAAPARADPRSVLELDVAAAIVEERATGMHRCVVDRGDEDGMVAGLVSRDDATLEMRRRALHKRDAVLASLYLDVIEPVDVRVGKPARARFLILGENADADPLLLHEQWMNRRDMVHAGENEWRLETDGGERADRHAVI